MYYNVDVLNLQAIIRTAQTPRHTFVKIQLQHKSWELYDIRLKFNILRRVSDEVQNVSNYSLRVCGATGNCFWTILLCIYIYIIIELSSKTIESNMYFCRVKYARMTCSSYTHIIYNIILLHGWIRLHQYTPLIGVANWLTFKLPRQEFER